MRQNRTSVDVVCGRQILLYKDDPQTEKNPNGCRPIT